MAAILGYFHAFMQSQARAIRARLYCNFVINLYHINAFVYNMNMGISPLLSLEAGGLEKHNRVWYALDPPDIKGEQIVKMVEGQLGTWPERVEYEDMPLADGMTDHATATLGESMEESYVCWRDHGGDDEQGAA
ncbi:hypothetical protein VTK26DRAFT_3732 [Humicola hyalothermophila]